MFMKVANKDFSESEFEQAFVVNANSKGYTFTNDDRPILITQSFFAATAAYLSKVKKPNEDEVNAVILTSISGDFEFGAFVEYHPNEDNPDEPGNWSFGMTFYEEDIKRIERNKVVKKHLYNSDMFRVIFNNVANDHASINFTHEAYIYDAYIVVISTLKQILDREALLDEVIDIEMPGYFTASVGVENGEKVFSIVPGGFLKNIIKDDLELDKNNSNK